MKASENIDHKILDYLDGTLSITEQKEFEAALQNDKALKNRFEMLHGADFIFKKEVLLAPPRNFTHNVMSRLDQHPLQSRASMLNTIMLIGGVIVLVSLCVLLLSAGFFDAQTFIDLNNVSVVHQYLKKSLPLVSVNGKLVINILIFLNLILALIVVDRAVLKPLFQRRMHTNA